MKDFLVFKLNEHSKWIDDLGPSIPDIESICLNCGLEETIPNFIYDEMVKKKNIKN